MLSQILPAPLVGAISLFLHTINTFFWATPILIFALLKFLLPFSKAAKIFNYLLNGCATAWIGTNGWINRLSKSISWEIDIPTELSKQQWYLVVANHKSWLDIMALQQTFNGKIPFLKFFLKQELFWVPVLGLAWWALDFPFMKRYNKSYLKKYPHKKGQDFITTQKACEKFKSIPISIMNFAEGTRFSEAKKDNQNSPYQHLLKPKSGGIGYVLSLMGEEINQMLDVTINYPDNDDFSFWDFLCGRVPRVQLHAELVQIPQGVKGDYVDDPEHRKQVQQWLNQLWSQKDRRLALYDSASTTPSRQPVNQTVHSKTADQ